MIDDDNQQFLGGVASSKRAEAGALRAACRERSKLRKTATKPAEFSSPNRSTQSYCIVLLFWPCFTNCVRNRCLRQGSC
jgi:hypothetical protein